MCVSRRSTAPSLIRDRTRDQHAESRLGLLAAGKGIRGDDQPRLPVMTMQADRKQSSIQTCDDRDNVCTADLSAFLHNVHEARKILRPSTRIFQVIKGSGYGLGIETALRLGVAAGIDSFCAGTPSEALFARKFAPKAEVLLFSSTPPSLLPGLVSSGVIVTVNSEESLAVLLQSGAEGRFFVEVDFGGGRFGLGAPQLERVLRAVQGQDRLTCVGVYTHFGKPKPTVLDAGVLRFDALLRQVRDALPGPVLSMVASSAPMLMRPHLPYDAVDPGSLLYGLYSTDEVPTKPVLAELRSHLIQVTRVRAPTELALGYGERVMVPASGTYGVFPLGWLDGLSPRPSASESVVTHGERVPVIARTLLNSLVDLSGLKSSASVGDALALVGGRGESAISLVEAAEMHGLSTTQFQFLAGSAVSRR